MCLLHTLSSFFSKSMQLLWLYGLTSNLSSTFTFISIPLGSTHCLFHSKPSIWLTKISPPLSLSHLLSFLYQLLSTHQNFSTVNLPRASSLYGSTSNLSTTSNLSSSRAFRGSNPNLASHPGTIKFYWVLYSKTFVSVTPIFRYGEVELLLLVHELGAEQTEAEAGHCQESGKGGDMGMGT